MMKGRAEMLVIPAGTMIKINGIPFTLKEDTEVYGLKSNLKLALELLLSCDMSKGSSVAT